jgi:glutamyl-tRNA synthetase
MDFTKICLPKHIRKQIEIALVNGSCCTRFLPEPSGQLHLGHIFAAKLNQSIATVYGGKFLIRFDDTNPELESQEFVDGILEDLIELGFDTSNISSSSDYFDILIDKAIELIKNGFAYVESASHEEMIIQRKNLSESMDRYLSTEDHLTRFDNMLNGSNTTMCLRLKAFYNHKNAAMRDPVLFRSINKQHHKTGSKYKIYPTYDFACPIVDSIQGITHIFRSKEYVERDDQMKFILEKLNMTIPKSITYGRISVENAELSKRKIKEGIINGKYSDWDDKKLFTVKGMKARGINVQSLDKLLNDIGFPESMMILQQQKIFTINMKIIDKFSTRLIAIEKADTCNIQLEIDNNLTKNVHNFIGNKDLGEREISLHNQLLISAKEQFEFQTNEEITILHFGNVIYSERNVFIPNFSGDPSKTNKKILWLNSDDVKEIKIIYVDGSTKDFLIESYFDNLKNWSYVQLNKMGYFYKINNTLIEMTC